MPVSEKPRVEHHQNAAHIARAVTVQEKRAFGGIEVARGWPITLPLEELHGDQRVEEVGNGARVQAEFPAQLRAGEPLAGELGEDAELDRGEEHLGGPERERGLKNG